MRILGIPLVWLLQDVVALVIGVLVLRYAVRREKAPGQIALEFFCFCFLYAAIYENGASAAGLYGYGSGTSYSTAEVAGAAALVWAANPSLTAPQVVQILEQTTSQAGLWNPGLGYGVLNVAAAVAFASGKPDPTVAAPKVTPHVVATAKKQKKR